MVPLLEFVDTLSMIASTPDPSLINHSLRFFCILFQQVAITGDIKKAFLLVSFHKQDCDLLRFFFELLIPVLKQ